MRKTIQLLSVSIALITTASVAQANPPATTEAFIATDLVHEINLAQPGAPREHAALVSTLIDHERAYNVYVRVAAPGFDRFKRFKYPVGDLIVFTRANRERALNALSPELRASVIRQYKTLPMFSAVLTAQQIKDMAHSPYVASITPWRKMSPLWSEAQEITGIAALLEGPDAVTGEGAVIAFIDSRFDARHPSLGGMPYTPPPGTNLNEKIIGGVDIGDGDDDPTLPLDSECVDERSHGTAVATIGAGVRGVVVDDGVELGGAAPDAKIVAVKMGSVNDSGNPADNCSGTRIQSDFVAALDWIALNHESLGIDIVTTSLGLTQDGATSTFATADACAAQFSGMSDAYQVLKAQGLVLFAAAGNFGIVTGNLVPRFKRELPAPACLPAVISVGMTYDADVTESSECAIGVGREFLNFNAVSTVTADHVSAVSNNAPYLDLLAPGIFTTTGISVTSNDEGLAHLSCSGGTSFSAPLAAGLAALLVERAGKGNLNHDAMRQLLTQTGVQLIDTNTETDPDTQQQLSKPRIDAGQALLQLDTDADFDTINNSVDNCIFVANADQRDSNGDGFGNLCDTDLTNDGVTNFSDLALFRMAFFTPDADADFNGDGIVNILDLAIFRTLFFRAPGPSGLVPVP